MEPIESQSVTSSTKDTQLGEPFSCVPSHHHDPQASDLNNGTLFHDAVADELQNTLDLKDGDETQNKGSNFEDGDEKLSDEAAATDGGKVEECVDGGGDDVDDVVVDGDDGWDGGDEGCDWVENVNESESESDKVGGDVEGVENKDERSFGRAQHYPLRPEAEDCAFYLRTGTCKFGFNCKFNHPFSRKNQARRENVGESEEQTGRSGQTECKFYLRSGGCKFGKACKFNHTRGKCSASQVVELNFLGLPIRMGERECPYYMRTGSCKFGANCKFNHPDPTAGGGVDSPSSYGNGSSIPLQGVSQSSIPPWSSTRTLNESAPFVPVILSANPGVSPRSSEWNGYQAPVYLSERNLHSPSTHVMNNPAMESNAYMHHQKQEEFPERPGEPECSYFLKTGDCKYKYNCKFHHPKNRNVRLPTCNLSDRGLPLRPDQNICTYYSRYGLCKFGPACKYDHPPESTMIELDEQQLDEQLLDEQSDYANSASVDLDENGGTNDENQPSVETFSGFEHAYQS